MNLNDLESNRPVRFTIHPHWVAKPRDWDFDMDDMFHDHGACLRCYWPTLAEAEWAWEQRYRGHKSNGTGLEPEYLEVPVKYAGEDEAKANAEAITIRNAIINRKDGAK